MLVLLMKALAKPSLNPFSSSPADTSLCVPENFFHPSGFSELSWGDQAVGLVLELRGSHGCSGDGGLLTGPPFLSAPRDRDALQPYGFSPSSLLPHGSEAAHSAQTEAWQDGGMLSPHN